MERSRLATADSTPLAPFWPGQRHAFRVAIFSKASAPTQTAIELMPLTYLAHLGARHPCLERLFLLGVAENWRLGKGKKNHLLAGYGADVMVQGQHLDAGDLLDHRFHDRTGRLDQMSPHLLQ